MNIRAFLGSKDGAMTEFGLFMFITMMVLGGLSIDVSNLMAKRTQLQVASDIAGHTALYIRDDATEEEARLAALQMVERAFPTAQYGTILSAEEIQFGIWDRDTQVFTASPGSKTAVMVTPSRTATRGNAVASYVLQLLGIDRWDVLAGSVFETYTPLCFREGFVAQSEVDIQSNNLFTTGFCVHSNTMISINTNNTFEDGSVLQLPDKKTLDRPSNDDGNYGVDQALNDGAYRLRVLNKLPDIMTGLLAHDPEYLPDYIDPFLPTVTLSGMKITQTDLIPGRVHYAPCLTGQMIFDNNIVIKDVVVVAECQLTFREGAAMEDAIIATRSTNKFSLYSPNGFRIGRDDHCADGGDAQLLTLGGVKMAANMEVYGGQILALDDVIFTANADGVEGVSIVSGGTLSGTANMDMGFCGGEGMENNFFAWYFRLAA